MNREREAPEGILVGVNEADFCSGRDGKNEPLNEVHTHRSSESGRLWHIVVVEEKPWWRRWRNDTRKQLSHRKALPARGPCFRPS